MYNPNTEYSTDPSSAMIILLNQILLNVNKFKEDYISIHNKEGRTDGFTIVLPVNRPTTKLFFDSYHEQPVNLPPGTLYKPPYSMISRLTLINEGLCDIQWRTNTDESSEDLTMLLRSGEDNEVSSDGKKIYNLFMRAVPTAGNTNATVRLQWLA